MFINPFDCRFGSIKTVCETSISRIKIQITNKVTVIMNLDNSQTNKYHPTTIAILQH